MANQMVKKAESGKTLEEVKALIDGLPEGLDLAKRLAIFKESFSVSKRGFKEHGGPIDDTINNAITGKNWTNDSTRDNLCQAATTALVKKFPGLPRPVAARAGKWLANGPILTSQSLPGSNSATTSHLEFAQLALNRLHQAREAFKRSSKPEEPWRLMEQSIRGLKDDFETAGAYAPKNVPEIEQAIQRYLDLAETLCTKFLMSATDEQLCRPFTRRVLSFARLHTKLLGRTETFIIGDPALRFRLANFDPLLEEKGPYK